MKDFWPAVLIIALMVETWVIARLVTTSRFNTRIEETIGELRSLSFEVNRRLTESKHVCRQAMNLIVELTGEHTSTEARQWAARLQSEIDALPEFTNPPDNKP